MQRGSATPEKRAVDSEAFECHEHRMLLVVARQRDAASALV
jgi:hypothetical protein